ncbi:hypothetical protein [Actinocorallia libanotica]|uniref:Uncharacterized protein n=1 Tax=Actinocorallia libanotica TaxID=46162 RepID=A0ABN1RUV9_9ACTN
MVLFVLTPDPAVVRWCSRGFDTGHPGFILVPIAIGHDQTDRITALEDARNNLGLAILSALTHGDTPEGLAILDTVVEAVSFSALKGRACSSSSHLAGVVQAASSAA